LGADLRQQQLGGVQQLIALALAGVNGYTYAPVMDLRHLQHPAGHVKYDVVAPFALATWGGARGRGDRSR
jgi:hypothetical protein